MAKNIKVDKPFIILHLTREEMANVGSPGICDHCNENPPEGYFVAVLNCWICKKCFDDWVKRAKFYQEDKVYERRFYDRMLRKLNFNPQEN